MAVEGVGIIINGMRYRELRCKNDSCRELFMYERALIALMVWICPRCGNFNEYRFTMLKTSENMRTIEKDLLSGKEVT